MTRHPLLAAPIRAAALALACVTAAWRPALSQATPSPASTPLAALGDHRVIPVPASVVAGTGAPFALTATTAIVVPSGNAEAARVGEALAALLRPATGFA